MYFNQESEFDIIGGAVSSIFGILQNSIRLYSGNREIYREAGTVDILKEYLKQSSVSTDALMVLAYRPIVKESESKILAESDIGVATLVQLLQQAVHSSDHLATLYCKWISALELTDCLNHLAINDDNKRAIETLGGIPIIIHMLQDEFSEEVQTAAVEMLWNLAFVESIRQSEQLQDAVSGKKYNHTIRRHLYDSKYSMWLIWVMYEF